MTKRAAIHEIEQAKIADYTRKIKNLIHLSADNPFKIDYADELRKIYAMNPPADKKFIKLAEQEAQLQGKLA